ncbi:MAG: manganese-binding transcriptional regulator MntR [Aureliella sp.]|jgi:DtxR family manganese transport transcriptional regulator
MSLRSRDSEPHRRTRRDHSSETAEDYVEAVAEIAAARGTCRVIDLARAFAVSHVTVTRIVSRLKEEGLLESEPYGPVALTTRGRRLAAQSQARHDLVYRFLVAIGVDPKTAAVDAEGIEHHVSKATLDCFRTIVQEREGQ